MLLCSFAIVVCMVASGIGMPLETKIQNKTEKSRIAGAVKSAILNPSETPKQKPAEDGKFHDGDMRFAPGSNATNRNALTDAKKLWPDGKVPYVLADGLSDTTLEAIRQAMADFQQYTCIRFQPRKDEFDYIRIEGEKTGCHSYVGRIGGAQQVNLDNSGCSIKATAIHELMHSLGFDHEQNRNDRDQFVTIHEGNVKAGELHNFKLSGQRYSTLDYQYDYSSVMHYGRRYFSKDDSAITIEPKDPDAQIGQRLGFSVYDVKKINTLYKCNSSQLQQYTGTAIKSGLNLQLTFTEVDIQIVVNKANAIRKAIGSSNMRKLAWNNDLAVAAKAQVETCNYVSNGATCGVGSYIQLGALYSYFTSVYLDAGKLIETWLSSVETDDQILWAETKEIGCGIAQCGGLKGTVLKSTDLVYYVTCYFGPAASQGQQAYQDGPACSACTTGDTCDEDTGLCLAGPDPPCAADDEWSIDSCAATVAEYKKSQNMDICGMCVRRSRPNPYYQDMKNNCGNYCKMC